MANPVGVGAKKKGQTSSLTLLNVARPKRFELLTPWFVAKYSIQLSYGRGKTGAHYTRILAETEGFEPSMQV
jgi:hypothetical protein